MKQLPVQREPKFLERLKWGGYAPKQKSRLPHVWPTRPDKAYYRKLFRRANQFVLNLKDQTQYDLWHTHFDWEGFSEIDALHRRRHLVAGFKMLKRVSTQLKQWGQPHQVFLNLSADRSSNDALYVHTRNASGSPFPHELARAKQIKTPPAWLRGLAPVGHYEIYCEEFDGRRWYVVRATDHLERLHSN